MQPLHHIAHRLRTVIPQHAKDGEFGLAELDRPVGSRSFTG
jgi:hypothetical protein